MNTDANSDKIPATMQNNEPGQVATHSSLQANRPTSTVMKIGTEKHSGIETLTQNDSNNSDIDDIKEQEKLARTNPALALLLDQQPSTNSLCANVCRRDVSSGENYSASMQVAQKKKPPLKPTTAKVVSRHSKSHKSNGVRRGNTRETNHDATASASKQTATDEEIKAQAKLAKANPVLANVLISDDVEQQGGGDIAKKRRRPPSTTPTIIDETSLGWYMHNNSASNGPRHESETKQSFTQENVNSSSGNDLEMEEEDKSSIMEAAATHKEELYLSEQHAALKHQAQLAVQNPAVALVLADQSTNQTTTIPDTTATTTRHQTHHKRLATRHLLRPRAMAHDNQQTPTTTSTTSIIPTTSSESQENSNTSFPKKSKQEMYDVEDDSEAFLVKVIAQRSRESAQADNDGNEEMAHSSGYQEEEKVEEMQEQAPATTSNYSRNVKKRLAGPLQPGAFEATPGEDPSRIVSLRYSRWQPTVPLELEPEGGTSSFANSKPNASWLNMEPTQSDIADYQSSSCSFPNSLAVASLIKESSQSAISEATLVGATDKTRLERRKAHKKKLALAFLSVLLAFIAIFLLSFLLTRDGDKNSEGSLSAASEPSSSPTHGVLMNLPSYTVDPIISDGNTPQARAFHWLRNDPYLGNYTEDRKRQRFALATFYHATSIQKKSGTNDHVEVERVWKENDNWLSYEHHECDWFFSSGFNVAFQHFKADSPCGEDGSYERLWLPENDLQGTLPLELYWLTSLQSIHLSFNLIGGSLSSLLGQLSNLRDLAIDENMNITSSIPTEIGLLTNLQNFMIENADLTGSLPIELGQATDLEVLALSGNHLSGQIPSELGLLNDLDFFILKNNHLGKSIPKELWQLTTLRFLLLSGNSLSGSIPSELGLMTNLFYFFLDFNQLTGTLVSELYQLTGLRELGFVGNGNLTGSISSDIRHLSSLNSCVLFGNQLTGTIPLEIGEVETLKDLLLQENNLHGPIPSQIGRLTHIEYMDLASNHLTSTIPTEIGKLTAMTVLDLGSNQLSGPIPSEIGLLTALTFLRLANNPLMSGALPLELLRLTLLDEFSMYHQDDDNGPQ